MTIPWLLLSMSIAQWFSRRVTLLTAFSTGILVLVAYVQIGSMPVRTPLMESAFHCVLALFSFVPSIGFIALYQLAVEIYPTCASVTGGSIIIGWGRLGSLLTPIVFEMLNQGPDDWRWFMYLVAALCFSATMLLIAVNPSPLEEPWEATSLLDKK